MKIILGTRPIRLRPGWYPGLILLGKTRFYPTQVPGLVLRYDGSFAADGTPRKVLGIESSRICCAISALAKLLICSSHPVSRKISKTRSRPGSEISIGPHRQ